MPQATIARTAAPLAPIALATLLATALTPAFAETDPYYFGISQSLGHNSNLYRLANNEIPDKFATTSINLGFDQLIGRQRLFANASARATRYEDIKVLDNTGYGLSAGLDWSTIERLSGHLGVALNKSLADYAVSGNQVALTRKNLETSGQVNFRAQIGVVTALSLNTSLSHSQISYSAPEYQLQEVRQNAGSIGITYRPSGLLTLGSALRVTQGEYANIVRPNGDKETFDRKDLDLTATWLASGLSTLNARLSFGRSAYETQTQRNFKGATGSLGWAWRPTGKLTFNTNLSRDSGTESSFVALASNQGTAVGDNSVLTHALALNAGYEATAKIQVNLGARYARRQLVNDQIVGGVVQVSTEGSDSVSSVTLGATYAASRAWQLGCNAGHDSGKPSSTSSGVSSKYSVTTASCNVQFTIR